MNTYAHARRLALPCVRCKLKSISIRMNFRYVGPKSLILASKLYNVDEFGARKHWRAMRCRDPGTAKGIILQVLRRSWGMAAFRENARLVVRRLGRVNDARAQSFVVNTACERRQLRRRYEYASEHHRYGSGRRGSRSP